MNNKNQAMVVSIVSLAVIAAVAVMSAIKASSIAVSFAKNNGNTK